MIVMMIPLEILLIPLYRMIINMKLINTKTGSILPFLIQPTAMFFSSSLYPESVRIIWMRPE